MGGLLTSCQSEEVREQLSKNKAIEKQLTSDRRAASSIIKLLLLGAGECGKSTVLKQMQILHSNGFTEEEINERKAVVYSNTVTSMAAILKAMDNVLHMPMDDASKERDRNLIFRAIENGEENLPFTDPIAKALQNLWGDKAVKKAYEMRSEYQLNDSAKYFLDSVSRIHEPGYRPTEQDILYSRVATTGVVEVKFIIKGNMEFRVFDVGGQRSERRKWIHCFGKYF
ncbi:unnamed protein product [Meloidogyne enterolobii]|uniref:Uncharacterized protein n=1 Tax=Meloidogyne enterolobii TaxID=390850 RepID=A0ACB1A0F8_MELEN